MNASHPDYERLVGYLLGDLPPEQQDAVEDEMLARDDLFEAALAVEGDLFDAYAAGSLEGSRRLRFEERYGRAPERRDRLVFARALQRVRPDRPRKQRPWLYAAAVVTAAALCAGLWVELVRTRDHLEALRSENQELARNAAASEERALGYQRELAQRVAPDPAAPRGEDRRILDLLSAPGPPARIAVLALVTGLERSGAALPALAIPADATLVRLELRTEESASRSYRMDLETAEGRRAWTTTGLTAWKAARGGAVVSALVPAQALQPGHYVALLAARLPDGRSEEVGAFAFRILPPG